MDKLFGWEFFEQSHLLPWLGIKKESERKKEKCKNVSYATNMYTKNMFLAQQPPVGQDLLIHEVSRSHTMHHSQ
jgi:hypothetical protein